MKRILCAFIVLCIAIALTGCGNEGKDVTKIGFSDSVSIEKIKSLDGKRVSINGYMATLSPVSGKFIYLMNMPYQSCPFCVPNTTQLSNTIAVYAPNGKTISFTDSAVTVTGTLKTGDFTDEYGYNYSYRIADAVVAPIDLTAVSEDYALWQTIAQEGIVADVNAMFDYLHFISSWPDYTMEYIDENGANHTVFLYPGDVQMYLADTGIYGYASYRSEGYFPGLTERVKAIDPDKLSDLVRIIESAKSLENYALDELNTGKYTYNEAEDRYYLTDGEELYDAWYRVYLSFSEWLGKWEM